MRTLIVDRPRSKIFISLIILSVLLALGVSCLLSISIWLKIGLSALCLTYGWHVLKHAPVQHLRLQNRAWYINHVPAVLLGSSTITYWVSVLRFQIQGSKKIYSCMLFRTQFLPDDYRYLISTTSFYSRS